MIRRDGWDRHSLWEHSGTVRELYARRCRLEAPIMDAHAQAADLLAPRVAPGDVLLDVGCGSGHFFHALRARGLAVAYHGIDASPTLIAIGREHLPAHGLPPERLETLRMEDMDGSVDHVVCLNVLTNVDNYHRPLERMLKMARKSVILRESIKDGAEYHYVPDHHLDGVVLNVHVNHYDRADLLAFVRARDFAAETVVDRRTGGRPEMVIGHPHHWTFVVADRVASADP